MLHLKICLSNAGNLQNLWWKLRVPLEEAKTVLPKTFYTIHGIGTCIDSVVMGNRLPKTNFVCWDICFNRHCTERKYSWKSCSLLALLNFACRSPIFLTSRSRDSCLQFYRGCISISWFILLVYYQFTRFSFNLYPLFMQPSRSNTCLRCQDNYQRQYGKIWCIWLPLTKTILKLLFALNHQVQE